MSTDLFKENTTAIEQTKVRDEEEIVTSLTEEFNQMFKRENLEQNSYLVSKMNSSLEIPITAIYKDKKTLNISTNLALIREGLNRSTSVVYDREKEILRPKIKAMKNKILLNKIPETEKNEYLKLIQESSEYSEKLGEKYIPNLRSYNIILKSEEAAVSLYDKIKAKLGDHTVPELIFEYEDLYLNLVQKVQDSIRHQSFNPSEQGGFPMDPYMQGMNYMYGMNPYQYPFNYPNQFGGFRQGGYANQFYGGGYYNNMFIRKAQDEPVEESNDYAGGRSGGRRRGDRFNKKGQGKRNDKERRFISTEEIEKKTQLNAENFPPLSATVETPSTNIFEKLSPAKKEKVEKEEEKAVEPEKKIRYKRSQVIDVFKKISAEIQPSELLKKLDPNAVPVLNLGVHPDLEAINPTPPKDVQTPKTTLLTPKQTPK